MSNKPDEEEDDWFNKDIDDFVVDIKQTSSTEQHTEDATETGASLLETLKIKHKQFFNGTFGSETLTNKQLQLSFYRY